MDFYRQPIRLTWIPIADWPSVMAESATCYAALTQRRRSWNKTLPTVEIYITWKNRLKRRVIWQMVTPRKGVKSTKLSTKLWRIHSTSCHIKKYIVNLHRPSTARLYFNICKFFNLLHPIGFIVHLASDLMWIWLSAPSDVNKGFLARPRPRPQVPRPGPHVPRQRPQIRSQDRIRQTVSHDIIAYSESRDDITKNQKKYITS